jgi:hypothetical protein
MGSLTGGSNRGTLQRIKLEGGTVETIVPMGTTNTPKQLSIDAMNRKLYWSDREGAKVWRSNLDGSSPEVLVSGHDMIQLVGMTLDPDKKQFYFSDRISGRIYRAGFEIPTGETADNRTDLEVLFDFNGAAMPIDLDLDLDARQIYWTDRLRGSVQRADMEIPIGQTPTMRADVETLAVLLPDTAGISLDRVQKQLYFTQLSGEVWRSNLDGSERRVVTSSDSASGLSVARLPQ